MPVRFGPVAGPSVRQVLQFKPDKPWFIVGGTDRQFDAETQLHWLAGVNRGVPCTHEDCPWCPLPWRTVVYVPVLAYNWQRRCWEEKVLPINDGMKAWLEQPRAAHVWEFQRRGYKNSPVTWQFCAQHKYSAPFAGFDTTASLYKMWGMYAHAKKTNDRPGEDRPRLFDEPIAGVG
jgi:hypothetical protein